MILNNSLVFTRSRTKPIPIKLTQIDEDGQSTAIDLTNASAVKIYIAKEDFSDYLVNGDTCDIQSPPADGIVEWTPTGDQFTSLVFQDKNPIKLPVEFKIEWNDGSVEFVPESIVGWAYVRPRVKLEDTT
ncbi:MAG: hypothetical protein DRG33_01575 [Deltaproteobacteria bacterium]|nr:MAG: hypothetical protein DRG33_01575 [Deltaproteobacteria bacterium]